MGNVTVKESGEMVNIISPNVNNITSFKVHFSPKQEGTGDPSPENVREIVGWNGVEGHKCGKNMAHIFGYGAVNISDTDINKYHTTNTYGTTISTTIFENPDTPLIIEQSQAPNSTIKDTYQNGYVVVGVDNLIFNKRYNVSFKVSNITNNLLNVELDTIRLIVPTGTSKGVSEIIGNTVIFKNVLFSQNTKIPQRKGFEIRICGLSFTLSEFMVTAVDNEDYTYEPFQDATTLIDWTDTVGYIYGGYVDLITGELVATQKLLTITGNEDVTYRVFQDSIYTESTLFLSDSEEISSPSMSIKGVCSFTSTKDGIISRDYLRKAYSDRGLQFYKVSEYWGLSEVTPEAFVNKLQTWNSLGTPLQICYSLANPITIATLSPTQLSTLKGQNNFWSNADYVEIEYELTETFDIQKAKRKIILNQPHVESTSGTIAKPETDMIGKIKECKIHFMPVQQSDSDPTPDNIVPVTGWTGINIYQAFIEYPITPIVKTIEESGVKWAVDKDGLMTAYGTPTAFTGANLGTIDVNGDETLYGTVAGNLNNVTFNKPTLLNSNGKNVVYTAGDGILRTGLDLSLYSDIKKVRIPIKRSGNVFMSGSCNVIIWKDKKPTISTTTIDWTNEVGTIYGGYVDLVSGELVQEYSIFDLETTVKNIQQFSSFKMWFSDSLSTLSIDLTPSNNSSFKGYCDAYPILPYGTNAQTTDYNVSVRSDGNRRAIYVRTDGTSDIKPIGNIVLKLETPIHYQLTPQQLTTLRGINNIWSSANGEVEIKYWKH